jgi:hypothetical protein
LVESAASNVVNNDAAVVAVPGSSINAPSAVLVDAYLIPGSGMATITGVDPRTKTGLLGLPLAFVGVIDAPPAASDEAPTLLIVARPTVFQLLGFPGVGKLTIGRELVALLASSGEPARLIDNHLTQNLIVDLVDDAFAAGVRDPRLTDPIEQIRSAVRQTIEELSPRSWSFIFTNFPSNQSPSSTIFENRALAYRRGSTFLPVLLECRSEELVRRIQDPERAHRSKLRNPETLVELMASGLTIPDWTDLVRLDVSDLTPAQAAQQILAFRD